ncbi:unnamed protein product [Rotaria magnacalcarata]|uniref:Uncharacterized protein n=1 Tax=Rotaria magnacalcarata TaxID=392030 RepID=A0A816P5V9_9BILA|nr:unnamed protein product [Rotaria magnacalcarata]
MLTSHQFYCLKRCAIFLITYNCFNQFNNEIHVIFWNSYCYFLFFLCIFIDAEEFVMFHSDVDGEANNCKIVNAQRLLLVSMDQNLLDKLVGRCVVLESALQN